MEASASSVKWQDMEVVIRDLPSNSFLFLSIKTFYNNKVVVEEWGFGVLGFWGFGADWLLKKVVINH